MAVALLSVAAGVTVAVTSAPATGFDPSVTLTTGGAVIATVTGKQDLVGLVIDPSAVDPEDVEMLQDLVMAAVNDALKASQQMAEQKMGAVTAGLRIPGLG